VIAFTNTNGHFNRSILSIGDDDDDDDIDNDFRIG
jgi:hypothetical protein